MENKGNILNKILSDFRFRSWVDNGEFSEYWEKWQEAHPEYTDVLEDAKAIVRGLPVKRMEVGLAEIETAYEELRSETDRTRSQPILRMSSWWKYAAAAVIILVGVLYWNPFGEEESKGTYLTATTLAGERKTTALPDSSYVTLNGNSSIEYAEDAKVRKVILNGEAHFRVKKKEGETLLKKFIVQTNKLDVEVLGTTFSVSNDSIWTTVVLEEGAVQLNGKENEMDDSKSFFMKPGEKVVFNSAEGSFVKEKIDAVNYNSWTQNKLSLVNRSVEELIRWFDHHYAIKIQIPEQYSSRELTGSVDLDNRETAIRMIAVALELQPVKINMNTWDFK